MFYILAVVIILSRLLQYANVITIYAANVNTQSSLWEHVYIYDFFYVIAMFTKVILGFFQVQGMAELSYRILNQQHKIKYL